MYPKNAASPPRIAIGVLIQIADGAVQTSGATITVRGEGGSESGGSGTTAYGATGIVYYTPTQAETNYSAFIVIASKTGCIPVAQTVITTNSATAGMVNVGAINTVATTSVTTVSAYQGTTSASTAQTGDSYAIVNGASGLVNIKTDTAAVKTKTDFLPSATAGAAGGVFIAGTNAATSVTTALTANITGNLSGSVGSVTGNVAGSTASVTNGVTLAASQHVIVDSGTVTTLTNLPAIPANWLTGTGTDATAVTKIQAGLATPTNITAGTITTVTNLTNAPTAGDLTAAMKASVTTAVPTATAIGTDAAGKVLVTPAQKIVTDASGYTTANINGDLTATMKSSVTAAVPTAAAIGTDAASKVLVTPANKLATDGTGRVTVGTNADKTGYTASTVSDKTGYSLTVTPPTAAEVAGVILATPSQKIVTDANGYTTSNLTGDLTATMKSSVNAEVDTALNTVIPGSPVAGSINAVVTEIDANTVSTQTLAAGVTGFSAIDTVVDLIKADSTSILTQVGTLTSTSGRVEAIMPTEIIKASSGDKFIEVFFQLYDTSRLPFTAHDMDGGNYSTNASYNPLERVLPTTNNAGAYYFQIGATVSGSPATAPDWSTAQTPAQTCLDGDGNTWTNIGASEPSTTALKNGFGVTCADDQGTGWGLYADNVGTPLLRVNECHHWDETNRPQILNFVATGLYSCWMNTDDAETDRTIYLTLGWFDKSRFEAGFSSTIDHRRVVMQTRIVSAPTLTLAEIEGSTILAKEATVAARPDSDLVASIVGTVVTNL